MEYRIWVNGQLAIEWSAWFDGLQIANQADGTMLLYGDLPDQAALFSILNRLNHLNLSLLSVTLVTRQADPTPNDR